MMKLPEFVAKGSRLAATEASTHYGREGVRLAAPLAQVSGRAACCAH